MENRSKLEEMILWDTLGTLCLTGVPILQSLKITKDVVPSYTPEITAIYDSIMEGDSFSDVIKRHPESFHSPIYEKVEKAENEGYLPETWRECADSLRAQLDNDKTPKEKAGEKERLKLDFFTHLSQGLSNGEPLLYIVRTASEKPSLEPMKSAILSIKERVESGDYFSEAMSQFAEDKEKGYFSRFDINMTRAGEAGGVLEISSERIVDYMQRKYDF